jgi:dATP pyrophosphohydrolase
MSRAPFQVLVIPFCLSPDGEPRYLLFKRSDLNVWQWIAGGGEDNEEPGQIALREAFEEAGISPNTDLIRLDSITSIPVIHFSGRDLWGNDIYVIPEFSFGIEVQTKEVRLSGEHQTSEWLDYQTARSRLKWDSNRTALWELDSRLRERAGLNNKRPK